MMVEPFASVDDLQKRWRILTEDEQRIAEVKLEDATVMIKALARNRGVAFNLDDDVTQGTLRSITCEMVKRSMLSSDNSAGVSGHSMTAGPFSENFTFSNPTGDLYLTASEKKQLGLSSMLIGSIRPEIHAPTGRGVYGR